MGFGRGDLAGGGSVACGMRDVEGPDVVKILIDDDVESRDAGSAGLAEHEVFGEDAGVMEGGLVAGGEDGFVEIGRVDAAGAEAVGVGVDQVGELLGVVGLASRGEAVWPVGDAHLWGEVRHGLGSASHTGADLLFGERGVFGDFVLEDLAVVFEACGGDIEGPAKAAVRVVVDESDGDFADSGFGGGGLNPELEGDGIAIDVEVEVGQRRDAIGLEAAEGVGDGESEAVADPAGDFGVDLAAVGRRRIAAAGGVEIAAAGEDIGVVFFDGFVEVGEAGGLVLLVAVHGDEPVVLVALGPAEGVADGAAVAEVGAVADDVDGLFSEEGGGFVGRTVVDDEDVVGVVADAAEDGGDVFLFVVDGNGDEGPWHEALHRGGDADPVGPE